MNEVLTKPNEWQWIDERCGLIFGWYTEPFLNVMRTWDVSKWRVLEWGSGASTIWWGKNAREVISVDHDPKWHAMVKEGLDELKLKVDYRLITTENEYVAPVKEGPFDCIIIDGQFRMSCATAISKAPEFIKDGGIIILDNFEFMPNVTEVDLFRINDLHIYPQPLHYYWRTCYWTIRQKNSLTDCHEANSKAQKLRRGM